MGDGWSSLSAEEVPEDGNLDVVDSSVWNLKCRKVSDDEEPGKPPHSP